MNLISLLSNSKSSRIEGLVLFIIIILTGIFCFKNLGSAPLQQWDEETNAQVVRETINSDNHFWLTLEGKPFFEKPPLWYYLTSAVVSVSEFSNHNLRLVSAIAGFLIILTISGVTRVYYSKLAAVISVVVMLSSAQLFIFNPAPYFASHNFRSADLDALQILLMVWSMICFLKSDGGKVRWFYAGIILCSLGFLVKGPLSFVPWMAFVFNRLVMRKSKIKPRDLVFGMILSFAMISVWPVAMYQKFGQPFLDGIKYHFFLRVATPLEGHNEPWYFYLKIFLHPGMFTGGFLAILWIISTVKQGINKLNHFERDMIINFLLFFVFITFTATKLAWYILPVYPIAAIMAGSILARILQGTNLKASILGNRLVRLVAIGGLAVLFFQAIRNFISIS